MKSGKETHGGNVFDIARQIGTDWRQLVDFSANINPIGPPEGLKEYLFENFDTTRHYPDPFGLLLREKLAAKLDLEPSGILAGNGTTALMYLVARALKPKNPVIVGPAFSEYDRALSAAGISFSKLHALEHHLFDFTDDIAAQVLDLRPDMIFLANPSSPAGRLIPEAVLEDFIIRAKGIGALVVLDEAFIDFTWQKSMDAQVNEHENLIVLRSWTKFYALPGLRLGYLTASSGLAETLLKNQEPWSINSLALDAGIFCMDQPDYDEKSRIYVKDEREYLSGQIEEIGLGRIIPGSANYIIIKLEKHLPENLQEKLKDHMILIRDCASFDGMPPGYIRLSVNSREENDKLINALKTV